MLHQIFSLLPDIHMPHIGKPALDGHLSEGWDLILFILYPQNLTQLLAHSECSTNVCRVSETVSEWIGFWRWSLDFHQCFLDVYGIDAHGAGDQ